MKNSSIETKGIIETIINRFLDIMSIKQYSPQITDFLRSEFIKSLEKVETQLKPSINFVTNEGEIKFMSDYVFQNLQSHADQIGNQMRQELQRGIMNKESIAQLQERLRTVFGDAKFSNRLKTVMRTEKLRANNAGAFSGAKQAEEVGIVLKKFLHVTEDGRTSNICKQEHAKYGSKEKAIPLDEDFVVNVDNKTYRAQYPPFHPNCFLEGTKIKTNNGYKNIENIEIGDKVLTHKNRYKEVYNTMNREIDEEIFEIETSKGKIEVTSEHPVMTNSGWKLVKELTEEDWILYLK